MLMLVTYVYVYVHGTNYRRMSKCRQLVSSSILRGPVRASGSHDDQPLRQPGQETWIPSGSGDLARHRSHGFLLDWVYENANETWNEISTCLVWDLEIWTEMANESMNESRIALSSVWVRLNETVNVNKISF